MAMVADLGTLQRITNLVGRGNRAGDAYTGQIFAGAAGARGRPGERGLPR